MIVKLLTEHHLEILSLKGSCRCSSESTLIKMSNCRKSHTLAHYMLSRWTKINNGKVRYISLLRTIVTFYGFNSRSVLISGL